MSAYDARDWHDFYVMVGGSAAALTGLVFVAMSLHSKAITSHPVYGVRAVGTLVSLLTQLFIAGAVLIPGQPTFWIGVEVEVLALYHVATTFSAILQRRRLSVAGLSRRRQGIEMTGASIWLVLFVVSGLSLMFGAGGGFYLLAAVMPFMFGWNVYIAWMLITEVSD